MRSKPTGYYHPKNWAIFVAAGLLWLLAHLPYRAMIKTGSVLGLLAAKLGGKKNQRIILRNLELCFPKLSPQERNRLSLKIWQAHAIAGLESAMAWWCSPKKFMPLVSIVGEEHLHAAQKTGRGIMLLAGHFTSLERQGRCVAEFYDFSSTAKHTHNPIVDYIVEQNRLRYLKHMYYLENLRNVQKQLQQGAIIGFLLDQDYGANGSVFAPFFNIPTATTTTISRIAKNTNSIVIPTFLFRNKDQTGYQLIFKPPLENYPSDDPLADATRFNELVESGVREYPEQYGWTYRRFATRPEGMEKIYD